MKKYLFSLVVILTVSVSAFSQPDTLWTRTYGGSYGDGGSSVQQTTDGGYIITGYTESYGAGSWDVYLIKTNANGDSVWSQTFGESDYNLGFSVQQSSDGGYIIAGYTYSYSNSSFDVYLIKTDSLGNEQWNQTFGGSSNDWGFCVMQTSDDGYIIAGETWSYGAGDYIVYLIKTDSLGIEQWNQTFDGSNGDGSSSVQQTNDGGYIIAGYTDFYGAGRYDVYLIKTDASGIEQWSQTFGGSGNDYGYSVQQSSDGGYIIAGCSESYGTGRYDVYLIKTNANGDSVWSQTFGGSFNDKGYSVQQSSDDGYIIAGYTEPYGAGSGDVYLIRLDSEGTLVEDYGKNQPAIFVLHPPYPNPFNEKAVVSCKLQAA